MKKRFRYFSILMISAALLSVVSCISTHSSLQETIAPIPAGPEFLVINEVASTGAYEFIELYNMSNQPLIITGDWTIQDNGKDIAEGAKPFRIPEGTVIQGKGYLLICPFEDKNASDVLNNTEIPETALCDSSFSIGAHDSVSLYFGTLLVDSLQWDTEVNSYGRSIDGSLEISSMLIPTPGYANEKEPEADNKTGLVINEIGSKGQDFIELYNSGNRTVTLDARYWALRDIQKENEISLGTDIVINPGDFYILFTETQKPALKLGSSDTVFLVYKKRIIDSYSWGEHVDSIGRSPDGNNNWVLMEKSPGKPNQLQTLQ